MSSKGWRSLHLLAFKSGEFSTVSLQSVPESPLPHALRLCGRPLPLFDLPTHPNLPFPPPPRPRRAKVAYRVPGANQADWVDIYNRMYRERIIFLGQEIDDEICNQIIAVMLFSDSEEPPHPTPPLYPTPLPHPYSTPTPLP